MSNAEELLINVNAFETRVALLGGGVAQEIHLARAEGYSLTGNIYLGRVERIVRNLSVPDFCTLAISRGRGFCWVTPIRINLPAQARTGRPIFAICCTRASS